VPTFPSEEWFAAYREAINASEEHRRAAHGWEGDVAFVIEAEPALGILEDVWAWLDLWHGECRHARVVDVDRGERARFVIRAPYSRWKEVLAGRLPPIKGMREGKLVLLGDLPAIVEYAEAANMLVELAASIPTTFPDEPDEPDE
jgi:putative sterol carrier protein